VHMGSSTGARISHSPGAGSCAVADERDRAVRGRRDADEKLRSARCMRTEFNDAPTMSSNGADDVDGDSKHDGETGHCAHGRSPLVNGRWFDFDRVTSASNVGQPSQSRHGARGGWSHTRLPVAWETRFESGG
jgi:hypothetical protein